MKCKRFRVVMPLIIFLMLGLLNFNSVVYADVTFMITDFDDVPAGVDEGVTGLFEMENAGTADYFETSTTEDKSFPNSLKCYQNAGAGLDGWLNLTTTFNYISRFNFTVSSVADWAAGSEMNMDFYDGTTVVIRINFTRDDGIWWLDDDGWDKITTNAFGTSYDYTFNITHLYTNFFLVNMTGTAQGEETLSINVTESWTGFDYIHIYSNTGTNTLYFDDFYINTSSGQSEWDTCYGDYTKIEKRFEDSIVGYGDQVFFDIAYTGDDPPAANFYRVEIINGSGYVCRGINAYELNFMVGFTPSSVWGEGTYYIRARLNTDSTWDIVCPFNVQSASINPTLQDWDIYSEFEVYSKDETARIFYRIPDNYNGHIVVTLNGAWYDMVSNLTGDGDTEVFQWIAMGEGNVWGFWLVRSNDTGYMNYTSFIVDSGGYGWDLDINGKMTDSVYATELVYFNYKYYGIDEDMMLCIYNNTVYNSSTIVKSSKIGYGSQTGTISWRPYNSTVGVEYFYVVLQDENGYIYDDGIDRILSVYDNPDDVPYIPPNVTGDGYVVPIVFMSALLIGGLMYYISSSGVFAGVGFMGALMFFATPGHAFSYLPTIYLFIIGIIVVIFAIFMFRS